MESNGVGSGLFLSCSTSVLSVCILDSSGVESNGVGSGLFLSCSTSLLRF